MFGLNFGRREKLRVEASDWLSRMERGASDADRAAFRRWYEADPAHAEAFDRIRARFGGTGILTGTEFARVHTLPEPAQAPPTPRAYAMAAGLAALLVISGAVLLARPESPVPPAEAEALLFATSVGERLDLGVETVPVDSYEVLDDRIIRTDPLSGATTHLLRIELARRLRPMSLERVIELRSSRPDAVPMVNGRSGKAALRLNARSLMSDEGLPIARYELIRPVKHEYLQRDRLEETSWGAVGEADFASAWDAELREAEANVRRETVHLATGLLLPVWDKLPEEQVQVIRIAAADGRSLLGREVPALCLAELSQKLGLDLSIAMPPDELAATVLCSGKPLRFPGPEELTLKRSLVNGSHRLELAGFAAARLPWYKAQGCFTEIIRYQTRLFVPVDEAAEVLRRLASR